MTDQPHIKDYVGKRVHMIGIGGSSMSGLAQMLHSQRYFVSGSDCAESHHTDALRNMGIPVTVGHNGLLVQDKDVIIFSAAIAPDNPERIEAARLGVPQIERAVLLGQIMENSRVAIAVSGTHGKTTTSAMLARILIEDGLNPTVHIGGDDDFIGGSFRLGGDIFIAEACEFNAGFLHMRPSAAVILNIDEDHLDFYGDINEIENTFSAFAALLPKDGFLLGYGDDTRVMRVLSGTAVACAESFGLECHNDWQARRIQYSVTGCASFHVYYHNECMGSVTLRVPGFNNMVDALAAVASSYHAGADIKKAMSYVSHFTGVRRRFELTGIVQDVKLYHDYGHNPVEMRTAVSAAKAQPHNRLWAVMQPHTYSRVKSLFNDYLSCTKEADFTLVTRIFAAREKDPGDIDSSMLVAGMLANGVNAVLTPGFDDAEAYLRAHWKPGDIVITMGCGNINLLNEQIAVNENA